MHYFLHKDYVCITYCLFTLTCHLVKYLTPMDVGVEGESTVLYVKWEGVDIKVTGADNFDWMSIVHPSIAVQVDIWDRGGCVFIHTARREVSKEVMSVMSTK